MYPYIHFGAAMLLLLLLAFYAGHKLWPHTVTKFVQTNVRIESDGSFGIGQSIKP